MPRVRILEDVHDVDRQVCVLPDNVFFHIGFEFAAILAIGTLESRQLTAVIA